jgi:isopentenyl-diphosphate delta-isomerase
MFLGKKTKKLIVVTPSDKKIEETSIREAHDRLLLHRAVTVFIFNPRGKLLITKRSRKKRLWPLYWESSCSTHVYAGETYKTAAKRRIKEELGIETELKLALKFTYTARYKNLGGENEVCCLFTGKYQGRIKLNKEEIEGFKWIEPKRLLKETKDRRRKRFAPWLKIALCRYIRLSKDKQAEKTTSPQ